MRVNRKKKNKHKHIKCMQLPGTRLCATNNNHKAGEDAAEEGDSPRRHQSARSLITPLKW